MKFKHWFNTNEMASVLLRQGHMSIPCSIIKAGADGVEMPCVQGKVVGLIDMRFEDPGAYPPPYNKLNNGSFFVAPIPGGIQDPEVIQVVNAIQMGYMPAPGEKISSLGYFLIPKDWFVHAQIFDTNYEMIKPALADVTGKRAAALGET